MKRILSAIFIICLAVSAFAGCSPIVENKSLVDFCTYEGVNSISYIQKVDLSNKYAKFCTSYKFTYNSEGFDVKAYISIPLDCSSENQKECILYNRGGNFRLGLLTDTDTAKICAATGKVVIASQYRGCDSGTGKDEFGGADINDIITLVDFCENTFDFTDMTDFCAAGVSRGGMMSYMLARCDLRVKRIIAISAVSDLTKAYNEREDMHPLLEECIGGPPQLLPLEYEKRSAIMWANEIKVPVLMIHSKGDAQVSYSQAEELKAKFDKNNTPCKLITYDDSIHGFHEEDISIIKDWLSK